MNRNSGLQQYERSDIIAESIVRTVCKWLLLALEILLTYIDVITPIEQKHLNIIDKIH